MRRISSNIIRRSSRSPPASFREAIVTFQADERRTAVDAAGRASAGVARPGPAARSRPIGCGRRDDAAPVEVGLDAPGGRDELRVAGDRPWRASRCRTARTPRPGRACGRGTCRTAARGPGPRRRAAAAAGGSPGRESRSSGSGRDGWPAAVRAPRTSSGAGVAAQHAGSGRAARGRAGATAAAVPPAGRSGSVARPERPREVDAGR